MLSSDNFLVSFILTIINHLFGLTKNFGFPSYGIAIIMLTVFIKMALYPLTVRQMKSMKAMQDLQPKIKEIQEKNKNKPDKAQMEMMELYKTTGINPLSGCLPLLLQMPILFALFSALNQFVYPSPELAQFLWIDNLSKPDGFFILPVLVAITTFLQQKVTMVSSDAPGQKTMLYMLPLLLGWMTTNFPSGLALYWVVFNVVGTIQQYIINASFAPKPRKELGQNEQ